MCEWKFNSLYISIKQALHESFTVSILQCAEAYHCIFGLAKRLAHLRRRYIHFYMHCLIMAASPPKPLFPLKCCNFQCHHERIMKIMSQVRIHEQNMLENGNCKLWMQNYPDYDESLI